MCMCFEGECKCKNKKAYYKPNKRQKEQAKVVREEKMRVSEEEKQKEQDDFRSNFGKRLTSARKMNMLSLEEAGKLFGFSKQALNRYELGKREITSEVIIMFSKAYKLPADYFFRRANTIEFGEIKWSKKLKYY